MNNYAHILVAVDLTAHSEQIMQRALDVARRYDARVSLIHVVAEIPAFNIGGDLMLPPYPELEQELAKRARNQLEQFAQKHGVAADAAKVVVGSARHEILRQASEQHADLIVVGRHSRRGLDVLLGSTATGVLHHAQCDVLAVHV